MRPGSKLVLSHKGQAFELAFKHRQLDSGPEIYRACNPLQQTISRLYRHAGIGRHTVAGAHLQPRFWPQLATLKLYKFQARPQQTIPERMPRYDSTGVKGRFITGRREKTEC